MISESSCNANIITIKLVSTGPKVITGDVFSAFGFFVDGEEKTNFVCNPITIAKGEESKCMYPSTQGVHEVEVRGVTVGNKEKVTVNCR